MWFICALLATLGWGTADLFYKKGSIAEEKYSHLKICIFVGIFMGLQAIIVLLTGHVDFNPMNIIYYLPVSMMYFLSMVLVFFGLKYIEVSIASPIENTYGAISVVLCFLFLGQRMSLMSLIGVILITIGIVTVGIFKAKDSEEKKEKNSISKKMTIIAFSMSVIYALLEGIAVVLDAAYLDLSTTKFVGANESNIEQLSTIAYGLTYLIIAIVFMIYIKLKGDKLNIKCQKYKISAAIFETLSQLVYYYAMAGNAIVAGPITSTYCVVSVVLANLFLKEKLSKKQYASIFTVIIGIVLISLAEVI